MDSGDGKGRARLTKYQAEFKGRIRNPETREFLHIGGGKFVTTDVTAWFGTADQAVKMISTARSRGLDMTGFQFMRIQRREN